MNTRFRIKDHWAEQRMFLQRCIVASVVILALILVLAGKLFTLQVVRYEHYLKLSQGNNIRREPIPPSRGLILDRNGAILAENLPAFQLELTPEQLPLNADKKPDIKGALESLSALGLITIEDIPQIMRTIGARRLFENIPIKLRMSDEEVALFAVHRHDFQGVDIRSRLTRYYPLRAIGVHALGYVGAINEEEMSRIKRDAYAGTSLIGKNGIEAAYEKDLHGEPGYKHVLVNAQGRPVEGESSLQIDLPSTPATSGDDLILAMDVKVQKAAEEAMQDRRGAVIALDPQNGDVIAFVSVPGFDPNLFGRGLTPKEYSDLQDNPYRPLNNRAIRGTYPPGSTVKPEIALAGLVYRVIDPNQRRFCNGQWRMPRVSRPWSEGRGGVHGWVDLKDAIGKSCDVYFYGLADTLGVDRLSSFLAPFGFGTLTGIDIPGEKSGILPSREWKQKAYKNPADKMWFPGETINFGIGQGYMTVTPLQLAQATAIIAGRGKHFSPRLARAIRDANTGKLRPVSSKRLEEVKASSAQWDIIVEGMKATMVSGTARAVAKDAPYVMAGKTGTAQVYSVAQGQKYNEKTVQELLRDHSWFVGFAPADHPTIVVTVLVENGGFGASAAAPVARKVMDAYLIQAPAVQEAPPPPDQGGEGKENGT